MPIDDTSCWIFCYSWNTDRPLTDQERGKFKKGFSIHAEVDADFIPLRRQSNDYLMDRNDQLVNTYTGIQGVSEQDAAIQNSQGPVVDRSREHLGQTDVGIIEFRKLILSAADKLRSGQVPCSAAAEDFAVQCGGAVAHKNVPLEEVMRQRFDHATGYVGNRYGLKSQNR